MIARLRKSGFLGFIVVLGMVMSAAVAYDLLFRSTMRYPADPVWEVADGDRERGQAAIVTYGCTACHVVPGIRHPAGRVGPKLEEFSQQVYIAGVLANTPENLIAWIQNPRDINPRTAMPDLGVTEADARDIAAYLLTQDVQWTWRERWFAPP